MVVLPRERDVPQLCVMGSRLHSKAKVKGIAILRWNIPLEDLVLIILQACYFCHLKNEVIIWTLVRFLHLITVGQYYTTISFCLNTVYSQIQSAPESNPHSVFGDFLNRKKLVCDSNPHLSFNRPLLTGWLIE